MVYDMFGNYTAALITMPVLLVLALFLLMLLFRGKKV
jgi:hypothetical protein